MAYACFATESSEFVEKCLKKLCELPGPAQLPRSVVQRENRCGEAFRIKDSQIWGLCNHAL